MLSEHWMSGKRPDGPYNPSTPEGRLRELEQQVTDLTWAVNTLLRVVRIQRTGDVEIVAARSLTLSAHPSSIELHGQSVTVCNGMSWPGKDIVK